MLDVCVHGKFKCDICSYIDEFKETIEQQKKEIERLKEEMYYWNDEANIRSGEIERLKKGWKELKEALNKYV